MLTLQINTHNHLNTYGLDDRIDVNLVNKDIYYGADGADVGITQEDFTPLFLAVFCEDNEIVKLLLMNKKIDVNILCTFQDVVTNSGLDNKQVLTPLHYAIEEQNVEIVKLLLNNEKININAIGSIGYIEYFFETNNLYDYNVNNFTTYFKDFEDKMIMKDLTPLEYAKRNSHSEEIINLLSQKVTK